MQAWRKDRVGVVGLCLGVIIFCASGLGALSQYYAALDAMDTSVESARIRDQWALRHSTAADIRPKLRPFHSYELVDTLNNAAATLSLPVNQMVFRVDDNVLHPYLRYSATVKLFGGYPAVRKFVDVVRKELPQTSLDSIFCTRTDIRSIHVSCELTLSTFYEQHLNE